MLFDGFRRHFFTQELFYNPTLFNHQKRLCHSLLLRFFCLFLQFQGPNNGSSMPSLAEPVYPCGICQKEVDDNDEAILCETGCGKWYHRVCTGLTVAAYHMLTNSTSAEWVCNTCIETKNIPLVKLTS